MKKKTKKDDWIKKTFPNGYKIEADIATLNDLIWDVYHKERGKYKYVQTFETCDKAVEFVNSQKKNSKKSKKVV